MPDIHDKFLNQYIATSIIPSWLPQEYRDRIEEAKKTYNPFAKQIADIAERYLADNSSTISWWGTISIGASDDEEKIDLFNQALTEFNRSAKEQGYGLYAHIEKDNGRHGYAPRWIATIVPGPAVE